ncbi:MAG: YybS family protein [Hyphomicrobium sp.]|jgi:magnesium-transporting ATPase (P-type)|nr:YybS family protein [Hyphomicrobium sp.]
MRNQVFIALLLGLVSAVVFLSATTGPMLIRFALFLLTSLPIFLAGLGWGWRFAALAGIVSVSIVAAASNFQVAGVYALTQILPAIVLSYLALLNRLYQPDGADSETVEWYPVGRLVLWAAVMAGTITLAVLVVIGQDFDELRTGLKGYLSETIKTNMPPGADGKPLDDSQLETMTDIMVAVLPAASAVSWLTALVFNLWLAGRITLAAGQLRRPWPDISAMEYPSGTALMLLASLLATGAKGTAGAVGTAFLGAFFLAYVLAGLAVIHYVTRAKPWRPFGLWLLYIGLLVVAVWIAVIIALVGLADRPLRLRERAFPSGPPPPPAPVST